MSEFEEFVLRLTNKARQQELGEIEAGILRSVGQVAELQAELEQARGVSSKWQQIAQERKELCKERRKLNEKLTTGIKKAIDFLEDV